MAGSEVFVCLDAAEILSVLNRAYKIGRIELPCSARAGVYLKTNHNKLSGGLLARAAHPPVLAEAAAAAVLATVAPPPVLLAETAAAAVLAEPAFPPVWRRSLLRSVLRCSRRRRRFRRRLCRRSRLPLSSVAFATSTASNGVVHAWVGQIVLNCNVFKT